MTLDVRVVGAGPAGLALAAELATRGLSVEVIAPEPTAPWHAGYGCFDDELLGLGLGEAVARRWARTLVHTDGGGARDLGRTYARLDTPRLQRALLDRCEAAGVLLRKGAVRAVASYDNGLQPVIVGRRVLRSRMVVDASGSRGLKAAHNPAVQVAWGELLRVDGHPWAPGEMVLMDWRRLRERTTALGDTEALPTFLYALPIDDQHVFLEETSLAARPALPLELCRTRLAARCRQLGIQVQEVLEVERCHIAMGGIAPERPQGATLPFGAAAGFVHPATGYSLITSLRRAPLVADTLAEALALGEGTGAAQAAYDRVWSREARTCRKLYEHGLAVLLDMPLHRIQPFYDAFFAVSDPHGNGVDWRGYMGDTLSPMELSRLMWRVFTSVDWRMRLTLTGVRISDITF